MMLGLRDVLRRRYSAQAIDPATGRPTAQEPEVVTIRASVQPAGPDDMETLPEGERTREGIRLYTAAALRCADEHAGTPADEVSPDGGETWWEVRRLEHHRALMAHRKAVALRLQALTVAPQPITPPQPAPDAWQLLRASDAAYEFANGFSDTYTQDADGWLTVVLQRHGVQDRALPTDNQAPHTWIWPLRDGAGDEVYLYGGAYLADLCIEIDPTTVPPGAERVVVWLGVVETIGQPAGGQQIRFIGVEGWGDGSRVYAIGGSSIGSVTVPYYAHAWGLIASLYPAIRSAPVDPSTGAVGAGLQRGAAIVPPTSRLCLQVGTFTAGGGFTNPLRFRAWFRLRRAEGP